MELNLQDYFKNYNKSEIEEYCKRILSESHVDFYSAFAQARKLTIEYAKSKPPNYITRNSLPLQMYDNMVGCLKDLYPNLMHEDKEGCPFLLIAEDLRMYPKKLSNTYVPGNIITEHVKEKRGAKIILR